jgi:tellurite methyltransferase
MTDAERDRARWAEYYRVQAPRAPRELLLQSLLLGSREGSPPGLAIDLGCGTGIETAELLRRGWQVVAIDGQADAIAGLRARVDLEYRDRLDARVVTFEAADLPAADLIWAGRSLPFCPPHHFEGVWTKILGALRPGARFVGDLFGPRHFWAGRENSEMTFHSAAQVKNLCKPLELEYFMEEEGKRSTVTQGVQHWHAFAIMARSPWDRVRWVERQ